MSDEFERARAAACKHVVYIDRARAYLRALVIRSFRDKALADLWAGRRCRIDARMHQRILVRLDAIEAATSIADLRIPGFDFHALHGFTPVRYTIHVNGPWCITFEFADGDAWNVDFEQYH